MPLIERIKLLNIPAPSPIVYTPITFASFVLNGSSSYCRKPKSTILFTPFCHKFRIGEIVEDRHQRIYKIISISSINYDITYIVKGIHGNLIEIDADLLFEKGTSQIDNPCETECLPSNCDTILEISRRRLQQLDIEEDKLGCL